MNREEKRKLTEALYRRAFGYTVREENEEQILNADGNWEPVKKKISQREVPPELSAIKTLLDAAEDDELTEEEMVKERDRLLDELEERVKSKDKQ